VIMFDRNRLPSVYFKEMYVMKDSQTASNKEHR
jgi:hypothetical protein